MKVYIVYTLVLIALNISRLKKLVQITTPEFKVKLILRPGANKLGFEEVFETIIKPYVRTFGFGKNIKSAEMDAAEVMCERIGLKHIMPRVNT